MGADWVCFIHLLAPNVRDHQRAALARVRCGAGLGSISVMPRR
jgi:hypothetical protein